MLDLLKSIDWTVFVPCATAIAAIIAPVLTTVFNNIHQSKMLKRKMYIQHSIEMIDAYLTAVGGYLRFGNYEEVAELSGRIYLYVPKEYWNDINELNNFIFNQPSQKRDIDTGLPLLTKVSQNLAEYTSKLRK